MTEFAEQLKYDDNLDDNTPFIIDPVITQEKVCVLLFTKNSLKSIADGVSIQSICHIDATYKLSEHGYVAILVGFSDLNRTFFPVAGGILSGQSEEDFRTAFQIFKRCLLQSGITVTPSQFMIDASQAEYNAILNEFPGSIINTCYFHVVKSIKEKISGFGLSQAWPDIKRYIDKIHYSKNEEGRWNAAYSLTIFLTEIEATEFLNYMSKQWLSGPFCRWSVYHSPPGIAKTNNPLEIVNKDLKDTYSLRLKGKVPQLIDILRRYLRDAFIMRKFHLTLKAPAIFTKTARNLYWKCHVLKIMDTYILTKDLRFLAKVNFADKTCTCRNFLKYKYD